MVEQSPINRPPLKSGKYSSVKSKPLPMVVTTLIVIMFISIYIAFVGQFHLFSVDKNGAVSFDYNYLFNSVVSSESNFENGGGDDDIYTGRFKSDQDNVDTDSTLIEKRVEDNTDKVKQNEEDNDEETNDKDDNTDDDYDDDDDATKKNADKKDPTLSEPKEETSQPKPKPKVITRKKNDDKPMNILILYPDDWRHDSLGSEKPYVLTPFLDQLAKEGIRFTYNAVTSSVCWMSRATLWMGQYSSRHKSYRLKCPRFSTPENWEHSWIKMLQKVGYHIGHIGKWQYYTRNTDKYFDWAKLFEGHHWETLFGNRVVHASDLAKEYALQFFDERPKDKPFVLSVAFYPPKPVGDGRAPGHQFSPTNETKTLYENVTIPQPEHKISFQKLPEFLHKGPAVGRFGQRYSSPEHFQASMRNYYALVTGVDKACKEIIDKLKQEGLYNNTMIIFTTDNGMFHGSHGLAGKWYPYQESIRVPLIIYDPRMPSDKVGTLDDSFTLNVDLAQTILGAAGVKPDPLMQGRDISDLYLANEKNEIHDSESVEKEPWREEFFYEYPSPEEEWIPSSTALVRKDWKYIFWFAHNREQLFNLKKDPLEMDDLYDSKDDEPMLLEMRKRHDELKDEIHSLSYVNDTESCLKFHADLWNR